MDEAHPKRRASARKRPGCALVVLAILGLAVLAVLLAHKELPGLEGRTSSTAFRDTDNTRLGRAVAPQAAAHPGASGFIPLLRGDDAFAARVLLADAAERSLEIQYYIWKADLSGTLLFEALHRAADRGVRVRLLLDDNNTVGLDQRLAALDAHANIEVRLFNPFADRRWRWLGYLTDFTRLNRRMHNKSFTADNQASIVGGRNIGDAYFDAGDELLYVDLDVLAIGPVVEEVSRDFDRYWASGSSYPAARILPAVDPGAMDSPTAAAGSATQDPAARVYLQAIAQSPFARQLLDSRLPFEWAPIRLVSDDPAKGLGEVGEEGLLSHWLREALGRPARELHLVSPYFVPGDAGVAYFSRLAGEGVAISILTNSLDATDVEAVHAGYAKRRKPLLVAGVELFEMKRGAEPERLRDRGLTGSSGSSLHAKTFAVDRTRAFIGSFNFDPRSLRLNTEMGFVIESPTLAGQIADAFRQRVPDTSYQVRLGPDGELEWIETRDGQQQVHTTEPATTTLQRAGVAILSILPIEWLL